jgi:hypothetical protein
MQMFGIQLVTSGVLEEYVQGAGGPNYYPLCGLLFALGLDSCLLPDKLKQNESLPPQRCRLAEDTSNIS